MLGDPYTSYRIALGAEGMDDFVFVIDVRFVVDDHYHVEPGAELASKYKLPDLGGDVRVNRFDTYDNEVVRRLRQHINARDRDTLVLEHPFHLETEREGAEELPLVRRHAHVRYSHYGLLPHGDSLYPVNRPLFSRAGPVTGILAEWGFIDHDIG